MKNKDFGKPLCRLITMVAICMLSLSAMAYDFSYTYQGKTLYYNITSSNTVAVTYYSSDNYFESNNYVSGDVVIPSSVTNNGTTYSVTSIGYEAFRRCYGLTSVTIPNSVTSIGNSAFENCSSLTSVTIPNSVTSIGNGAFYNCSSLTSVTIPNSVTSIGSSAFRECSSLTSISIPNSVNSIGEGVFAWCSSLTSVTIPNSVTSIGWSAFADCSSLTSVTIPNSVTSIGEKAFRNCSNLTSVTIPNSVTSIGNWAFGGCIVLTSITIGDSVTSIGKSAFDSCINLTTLNFNAMNCGDFTYNSLRYEYPPFYSCPISTINIGDSVQRIPAYFAYDNDSLTSVTIPNSVNSIGNYAFYDYYRVRVTCLASNPPTLGSNVFSASAIITIPMTNFASYASSDWNNYNINFEHNGLSYRFTENNIVAVYRYDETVTSVVIPSSIQCNSTTYSVTSIGNSAFRDCSSLTSVTIPNSVTSIGNSAFSGCNSLTSVTIPESVTSIGDYAFRGCSSLTSLNFNAVNCDDFPSYALEHPFYSCPIATINIGDSVQKIPAYFAYDNDSLTSLTIPKSITSIGGGAFQNCSSLNNLNFNAVNCDDFTYNPSNYEYPPFYSCPISTINIGDSVQRIPAYFAYNLDSLTFVTIPNSVTSIGKVAFCSCSNLTSVNIPESVTSIKDSTFLGCSSLNSVSIPNSVTSIGTDAFRGCSSLTSVSIPNSVTSIGSSAFRDCSSLTSVSIPNSVTSIGSSAFDNCSSLTTLNFNAINCSDFSSSYASHPFRNCPISTINIGDSVQRIPANFARDISSLTSVTIPNSVTSIGNWAFRDCSSLITLNFNAANCGEFPDGWYGHPFLDCPISTINIGDSVQRIPANFARSRSSLTSVTIPNSVTSIGSSAFEYCSSLTSVTLPNNATISSNAFSRAGTKITIDSITYCNSDTLTIGNYTFTDIGFLTFYLNGNAYFSNKAQVYNCDKSKSGDLIIPSTISYNGITYNVTSIGSEAFRDCGSLTSVAIPNSVTLIGNSAFRDCSSLTSVNIGNSVTSIGNSALYNCSSLTSITIHNSITSIGDSAFCGCSSLTTLNFNAINCNDFASGNGHQFYSCSLANINFGDSVQRIPANFAENKSDLISISIPDNITEIGNRAFQGCSGLIAVTIGNGVSSIGNAFRGCTNLTYLTVGSGVETIEDLAFIDCNMLSHITSKATTPPEIASSNVFPYPNECSLTVPCGSLGAYTDQMNRWYLLFNPRIDEDMVFAFSVSANDDAFGIVSNEALSCSVRKITAIPFDGYEFVSWNDGNTSNPRMINITNDTSFVAVFATIGSSALQEVESTREFVVYPNPARGFVTIEFEALQESSLLRIADLGGRVVKTFDIAAGTESIRLDLRDLPSGVYTLMIGNTTKKLIIE